jgi:hypothetical protein
MVARSDGVEVADREIILEPELRVRRTTAAAPP